MGTPRAEALSSETDGEPGPERLELAVVDIGVHSAGDKIAAHPRIVDHGFILEVEESRSKRKILGERPGQLYIRDSFLVCITNVDSSLLDATRATQVRS